MYEIPVLIVEDEPDGRELMSRMLAVANVPHEVAADGEEAWTRLNNETYCAVIIDLALPGMDGVQLIQNIRSNEHLNDLPCMAVTAYHTPELKQQAIAKGFDSYFPKPLDRTLVLNTLDSMINN